MFCMAILALSAAACGKNADGDKADISENSIETSETAETDMTFSADAENGETDDAEVEAEAAGRAAVSRDRFFQLASAYPDLSEEDVDALYRKIEDSGILDEMDVCLTGAVFRDYDGNGETDMIVCLYKDKEDSNSYADGCLYLFMNDDAPCYIYDDFCCYYGGWIFGDFGADVDDDGSTEVVFCVQGTGVGGTGDCQKFVIKYRDNKAERMELPNDFAEDYDVGLNIEIERDTESGNYKIYCPYLDERIVLETEEREEGRDFGANCRGYFVLEMTEQDGRQLLTGSEYLYAGGDRRNPGKRGVCI